MILILLLLQLLFSKNMNHFFATEWSVATREQAGEKRRRYMLCENIH